MTHPKGKSVDSQLSSSHTGPRPRTLRPSPSAIREANEKLVEALVHADEQADSQRSEVMQSRARETDLIATGELRERLMAIVSHDLRNPLSTIAMAAGLLARSPSLGPMESKLAAQIVDSSRRMRGILAQLIEFTRARLGDGFPLARTPIDLGELVRAIVDERRLTTPTEIRIESYGDLRGNWDADRLGAVVANLLGNAIEHAAAGTPIVVCMTAIGEPRVSCAVQNEGVSIPLDLQKVIFEPFRQADPLRARAKGNLGLGLYIASANVRAHGGTLVVESGGGRTTFTFELPRSA